MRQPAGSGVPPLNEKPPDCRGLFVTNTVASLAEVMLWCTEFGGGFMVGGDVDVGAEAMEKSIYNFWIFFCDPLGEVVEQGGNREML
ncbi:MAG: hypothetical protein KC496_01010 [Anaerolineae bacterium]|nr:hypothetical protein [Anaerolineae bacterium]